MTALPSIDPALAWDEQIDRAEPDLVRHLLKTFVQALMGAEADAMCGGPFGARCGRSRNSSGLASRNAPRGPCAEVTLDRPRFRGHSV
jgi:transposase-like protein